MAVNTVRKQGGKTSKPGHDGNLQGKSTRTTIQTDQDKELIPNSEKNIGANQSIADIGKQETNRRSLFNDAVRPYIFSLVYQSIIAHTRRDDIKIDDVLGPSMEIMAGIKPMDAIESMFATQIISVHNLCMEQISRAANSGLTENIETFTNSAAKLSRTFIAQIEALERYRGRGGQKPAVGTVNVNEGGQAVIGNLAVGSGSGNKK